MVIKSNQKQTNNNKETFISNYLVVVQDFFPLIVEKLMCYYAQDWMLSLAVDVQSYLSYLYDDVREETKDTTNMNMFS